MPELPLSIAQHYHERTKYDPQTIRAKNKQLDWEQQPVPFKEYKIGATFDLKPYLRDKSEGLSAEPDLNWWQRLSRLLLCSYGLTAKVPTMGGEPLYLRAAPSAGGLYPAEIYLISRGSKLLPAGLYNYQVRTHTLVHFWHSEVWQTLQAACFWHPSLAETKLAIAMTAVFFRSAWRYEDRAYRRIYLDTGHLLGNIELACALNDYRPHLIGGFADRAVNDLLYVDSEVEGAIAIAALADLLELEQNLPKNRTALPGLTQTNYPKIADGQLLAYLHKATMIDSEPSGTAGWKIDEKEEQLEDKYNFPFCTKVSAVTPSIPWGVNLESLENTIFKRRSTRAYTGAALSLGELLALLDFTYQSQHYIDQGLDASPDYFDLSLIETFIAVSGVNGLEEGCYYYAPKAQELRQIRFKNFRRELHFLCLGQELGRDAGVVLFHTADLKKAVAKYGDRVYRYLHLDAGHLGQRLNLAAIHLRLGVSGIGGFFDDHVNDVLGIPTDEAVLYITTLGRPK
jgi:SagB-type dehydrogenase family enzyme